MRSPGDKGIRRLLSPGDKDGSDDVESETTIEAVKILATEEKNRSISALLVLMIREQIPASTCCHAHFSRTTMFFKMN